MSPELIGPGIGEFTGAFIEGTPRWRRCPCTCSVPLPGPLTKTCQWQCALEYGHYGPCDCGWHDDDYYDSERAEEIENIFTGLIAQERRVA